MRSGSDDMQPVVDHFRLPLLLSRDDGAMFATTAEEAGGFVRRQVEAMRAAGGDHTVAEDPEVTVLNATTGLYTTDLSRRRADGTEIGRLRATYLVTRDAQGLGFAGLILHA